MEMHFKENINISLYLLSGAEGLHGITTKEPGDRYIIALNGDESEAEQLAALFHELAHIYNGDFDDSKTPVQEKEYRVHRITREALQHITEREGSG